VYAPRTRKFHTVWLAWSAWLDSQAPTTKRTYIGIMLDWMRFVQVTPGTTAGADRLKRVTGVESLAYVNELKKRIGETPRALKGEGVVATLSAATVKKYCMCLRRAYAVLIAHKLFEGVNPFDPLLVKPPRQTDGTKRPTEMVPFHRVKELLEWGDSSPKAIRNRALLALLFGGGLRRGEAVNLLLGDIGTTPAGTWFVFLRGTKGKEDKRQAVPEWAVEHLRALMAQRHAEGAKKSHPLFNEYSGRGGLKSTERAMKPGAVYQVFRQACDAIGLGPEFTPHSARASSITKLLEDGVPHREVQEFSRHRSITMVELYDKRRYEVDRGPSKKLRFH